MAVPLGVTERLFECGLHHLGGYKRRVQTHGSRRSCPSLGRTQIKTKYELRQIIQGTQVTIQLLTTITLFDESIQLYLYSLMLPHCCFFKARLYQYYYFSKIKIAQISISKLQERNFNVLLYYTSSMLIYLSHVSVQYLPHI